MNRKKYEGITLPQKGALSALYALPVTRINTQFKKSQPEYDSIVETTDQTY